MSKQNWAALVYGRSYHLDFRFITVPQDFTEREIAWVSPYILATTQQARNLSAYPRWSLFKNDSHCVVGVTCMARDLLDRSNRGLVEVMTKDDLGRPLYVFVGYVTQISHEKNLSNFPPYTGSQLETFQPLYREIAKVWLAREYDGRQPLMSEYKPLTKIDEPNMVTTDIRHISQLSINSQLKYPQKTFLWHRFIPHNKQLWLTSARCLEPTSICLDIKGKHLSNSPFLNQTVTQIQQFTILDRLIKSPASRLDKLEFPQHPLTAKSPHETASVTRRKPVPNSANSSFKEKISLKVKEDLDLTLHHAAIITSTSQEIINSLTSGSNEEQEKTLGLSPSESRPSENFGFKTKPSNSSSSASSKQDWF